MKTNDMNNKNANNNDVINAAKPAVKGMAADKTAVNNMKKNDVNGAACPVDNTMKGVNYMPPKDENTL